MSRKTFKELAPEEQEEVLERYKHEVLEMIDWQGEFEWIIEQFIEEVKQETGIDLDVGDVAINLDRGAYFGVDGEAIKSWIYGEYGDYISWVGLSRKVGVMYSEFPFMGWRESDYTEWDYEFYDDVSEDKQVEIIGEIEGKISKLIDLCRKYFEIASEREQYLLSDEYIKEYIIANEWEFDENLNRVI